MGKSIFDRLEYWEQKLKVILALFFSFLIVLQILLTQEPVRFYLSFAERLEGVPWPGRESAAAFSLPTATGEVKIRVCSYFSLPRAVVLVNGREVADFQDGEVSLKVCSGDEIVIDGSTYDCQLVFQITAVSMGVLWPPVDYRVTTDASQVSLGRVWIER